EEARVSFEKALEIDPGHTDARIGLGLALFALGLKDGARGEMAELLRRDPTHPVARAFADESLVIDL
ncbi:MAG: tetratricopeptide repeat protein, partial [Candidatus Eisenbacteria bacterium]|nr:tetratricopeptide repeat protein [Candidatus Eisenbacteria bacterium]